MRTDTMGWLLRPSLGQVTKFGRWTPCQAERTEWRRRTAGPRSVCLEEGRLAKLEIQPYRILRLLVAPGCGRMPPRRLPQGRRAVVLPTDTRCQRPNLHRQPFEQIRNDRP